MQREPVREAHHGCSEGPDGQLESAECFPDPCGIVTVGRFTIVPLDCLNLCV